MYLHKVNNIVEAINLAEHFRAEGKYNWFRGQIQNWEVVSAFHRLNEKDKERAINDNNFFKHWIKEQIKAEYISTNNDFILAVGQHYDLKTTFIDWTTDPLIAGYFATTGDPGENKLCTIICLNTEDFERFWDYYDETIKNFIRPKLLEIEIPNLWRMQAQKGVFISSPYNDIECAYKFDRIIFPYNANAHIIDNVDVFPNEKSQLEIILEQFFVKLKHEYAKQKIAEIVPNKVELDVDYFNSLRNEYFIDKIDVDFSWHESRINTWAVPTIEKHGETISNLKIDIPVDYSIDIIHEKAKLFSFFNEQLRKTNTIRQKINCWGIPNPQLDENENNVLLKRLSKDFPKIFNRLWEGIRFLPYTNSDISTSLTNLILITNYIFKEKPDNLYNNKFWLQLNNYLFGESILVEYQNYDNSYSRSFASIDHMKKAFRSNLLNYQKKEIPSFDFYLRAFHKPKMLFNFEEFSKFFVRQILPIQLLYRDEQFIYNPVEIKHFGLP